MGQYPIEDHKFQPTPTGYRPLVSALSVTIVIRIAETPTHIAAVCILLRQTRKVNSTDTTLRR